MSSSFMLTTAFLSSIADRIVEARRLHGADNSYVIGLINGVNWFLESEGSSAELRRQFADRILESNAGKAPTTRKNAELEANGDSVTFAENSWIKGSVKWFNNDKGYGFITTDSDTDVFVHWRDISSWDRSLVQGDLVEFMVTKTAKGFQAVNVMKSETATEAPSDLEDKSQEASSSDDRAPSDDEPPAQSDQGEPDESDSQAPTADSSTEEESPTAPATEHNPEESASEGEDFVSEQVIGTGFGVVSSDNDTADRDDASQSEQHHGNTAQETDTANSRFFAEGGEA